MLHEPPRQLRMGRGMYESCPGEGKKRGAREEPGPITGDMGSEQREGRPGADIVSRIWETRM